MPLSLRELCKRYVFKNGISGREILPRALAQELNELDWTTRLNISGSYYQDYHVQERYKVRQLDIDWSPGRWNIKMRTRNEIGEIELEAGTQYYLAYGWRVLFLFVRGNPFPCQRGIVIKDFTIDTVTSSVTFYGVFYNHFSGLDVSFRTTFRFSVTNHFLKIVTEFLSGGQYITVGERFMRQPDTPQGDMFR